MPEHKVVHNQAEGRFEIQMNGETAFTEVRMTGQGIMFPHTLVPQSMEGHGVGGDLARTALDWARSQNQKVLPVCTFIAAWIRRHKDYHDLVHPLYRAALHLDDAELEEGLADTFPASDPPTATMRDR